MVVLWKFFGHKNSISFKKNDNFLKTIGVGWDWSESF